mmetsp:Transcript_16679/g.34418  ORF Transcript_16679/g.34418 Transcript_16679/m.34418 type:complete len:122 (-) Transcript_16679:533-898(-)
MLHTESQDHVNQKISKRKKQKRESRHQNDSFIRRCKMLLLGRNGERLKRKFQALARIDSLCLMLCSIDMTQKSFEKSSNKLVTSLGRAAVRLSQHVQSLSLTLPFLIKDASSTDNFHVDRL